MSTLTAIDNRDFYCSDCLNKYCGRKDADEMVQKSREMKGCFGIKKTPMHRISFSGGTESLHFSTCIGNFFDWSVPALLEMQRLYGLGVLPFPGALSQQPNKLIETFGVIEKYKHDKLERDRKARESKERGMRGR